MKSWLLTGLAQDTYQLLSGSPYLPISGSRRLQLRAKRFAVRSSSNGGNNSYWRWKGSSTSSSALCGFVVLVPWLILILLTVLLWRSKLHSLPLVVRDIPGGRQCTGWRQTYFCHPFA